jgi:hypothetical protein
VIYFTGVAVAKIIYEGYGNKLGEDDYCRYSITKRIIVLFGLVILPCFLLVILGAWCSMRSYNKSIISKKAD